MTTTIAAPVTEQEIKDMLATLAKWKTDLEAFEADIDAKLAALIPPQVAKEIEELRDEMKPKSDAMRDAIKAHEATLRAKALQLGSTVIGDDLEILVGTRTSWDTDKLEEGAKWVPAIAECKKTSDPFTTLRKVKK
jgi:hypothetical protein